MVNLEVEEDQRPGPLTGSLGSGDIFRRTALLSQVTMEGEDSFTVGMFTWRKPLMRCPQVLYGRFCACLLPFSSRSGKLASFILGIIPCCILPLGREGISCLTNGTLERTSSYN
jgi:hypothetical protein